MVLPILLLPVVAATGFSEVVEETAKALCILFLILKIPGRARQLVVGGAFGFLFGISENVLYLNQLFQAGTLATFWERLFWTVPMHVVTAVLIAAAGSWGKKFLPLGWAAAVGVHLLFNALVR